VEDGRVDHSQYRFPISKQPDRNGVTLSPSQEVAGAIVWIDDPAVLVPCECEASFFPPEVAGEYGEKVFAQLQLNFYIDFGLVP